MGRRNWLQDWARDFQDSLRVWELIFMVVLGVIAVLFFISAEWRLGLFCLVGSGLSYLQADLIRRRRRR
jgi:hypothetical protein